MNLLLIAASIACDLVRTAFLLSTAVLPLLVVILHYGH